MKRILPMPLHSTLLLLVWLLLNDFSAGHIVLGSILAILIPLITYPFAEHQNQIQRPLLVIPYVLRLLWDILISNLDVARRVLTSNRNLKPGFIAYPLQLNDDFPMTILASTISLTPGTVSVDFSEDKKWLYIHALHIDSEQEIINFIRQRYEQPLQEIFAC